MKKLTTQNKKQLKELQAELKVLQTKLQETNKLEGKDVYIGVKVKKSQARFQRIKHEEADKGVGNFYIELHVTTKQSEVFIPISIASGKKTAGFMYQIEGTGQSAISKTEIKVRGEGISQVTVGTLVYAKIPAGKTASFEIKATIRGKIGKVYKIVITRLNYKLKLSELRYEQYLKEIHSDSVKFS
jgi:hypothetical protein